MLFVSTEVNHTKTICMHSEDLLKLHSCYIAVCMFMRILYNIIILLSLYVQLHFCNALA